MSPEDRETLDVLTGTEAHRVLLVLLRREREGAMEALTVAPPDEVPKLQGEYRALRRLEQRLAPRRRYELEPHRLLDETSGY